MCDFQERFYDKQDAIRRLWEARVARAAKRDDNINRVASRIVGKNVYISRTAELVIKRYNYICCGGLTGPMGY